MVYISNFTFIMQKLNKLIYPGFETHGESNLSAAQTKWTLVHHKIATQGKLLFQFETNNSAYIYDSNAKDLC